MIKLKNIRKLDDIKAIQYGLNKEIEENKSKEAALPNKQWIGIDLGTTNSMVAFWSTKENIKGKANGEIQVVQNVLSGHSSTPSMVFYKSEVNYLAGYPAKTKLVTNFGNVMYDSKRILGKKFSDKKLQEYLKFWPFTVKSDSNDRP